MMESRVLIIEKHEMSRVLREQPTFSKRFIEHMLARNIRVEADLVDQLFNSSESGSPARCCCCHGMAGRAVMTGCCPKSLRRLSQRSWGPPAPASHLFMNKFKKLGFIDYNGDITIHSSLASVVLHE